jgi:GT2 family glycosyltransferase
MYGEDIELCWRLQRDGWVVRLEGDVVVPHIGNVAGAKAWGWQRGRRVWATTYDLDGLLRGRTHARAFAAVNALAVGTHLLVNRAGALAGGPAGTRRRHAAGQLRAELPVHVRAALHGPPPPL